nr:polysaccharide biosynthesis protein [Bacillus massiliigorillae]
MQGAFILTLSSIVIKLLSAIYRIPYQNIVGDVGFYIYQQVYPFYALVLVLSTYGFPVIISKLLAEAKDDYRGYTRTDIIVTSWFSLVIISIVMFCSLFFGASFLANIMNDPMLTKSIKMISFSFLLLPFISIMKGIFQSDGEMMPTAVAQVVEQSVRVGFILVFSIIFYYYGLSLYEVAEWAFLGSVLGSVISGVILIFFYRRMNRKNSISIDSLNMRRSLIPLSRQILGQGIIFGISSLILVFIQFMDALVLYPLLTDSGMEMTEAKQWKGVYDRGQPLLQLGTAATIALSLTIVPLISKFMQQQEQQLVRKYTELSYRLSIMLGMAATVGLLWIIEPVNIMLFTDAKGSDALGVLSLSILFCSFLMTGMFVLQSLGYSIVAIGIIVLGLLVKFALMLIWIPKASIMGAALSTTVAFFVMACMLFVYMRRIFKKPIVERRTFLLTLLASLGMSITLLIERELFDMLSRYFADSRLFTACEVLVAVFSGAVVYMFMIIRMGLFTFEELSLLPFGSKLAKFLPKNKQKH